MFFCQNKAVYIYIYMNCDLKYIFQDLHFITHLSSLWAYWVHRIEYNCKRLSERQSAALG